jgi:IclR family KDG regulon transcriptional repressor
VKTLDKFYKIVDLLAEHNGLRLQEIADSLGMNKSTVYRFLSSLLDHGYIKKDEDTSRYSLGLRFINIAEEIKDKLDLRKIVHPYLLEIGKLTGDTIHLTVFDGKSAVYIDKVESNRPVRMYSKIGNIAPIYCTAVGKAVLAFQSDQAIKDILNNTVLKRHTENTITNVDMLLKEMESIRSNGFAVDDGEHEKDICCIASPIRDHDKTVNAAISISAVKSRFDLQGLLRYKDFLREQCEKISRELGYR